MNKRFLTSCVFALSVCLNLFAYDFESDGICYNLSTDGTASVTTNPNGYSGDIVIPATISVTPGTYRKVTSIESEAFAGCTNISTVIIGDNIEDIGFRAFKGCTNITSFTIGTGVRNIQMESFPGNPNMKIIVKDIAAWCKITFTAIFGGSSNPLSITKHLYSDENTEITDLTIPEGVTYIPYLAFIGCEGLKSVSLPNSLTTIVGSAFDGCKGLTSITIPDNVTSIQDEAFKGCTGLEKVVIGDGVTSIGARTFSGCENLSSIAFGKSLKTIGTNAFYGCGKISKVIVSDIANWCAVDFGYSGTNVPWKINGPSNHLYSDENTEIVHLVIPDGVTDITACAFYRCASIKSITFPSSLKSIKYQAFTGCNGIERINISDLRAWCSIVYNQSGFSQCNYSLFLNGSEIKDLEIPSGIETIGNSSFGGCSGLVSVTLPSSVTSVGSSAFYGCTNLTSINFSKNLLSIGKSAFYNCKGLTSISFPNSITSIEEYAFKGCTGLRDVFCYAENVPNAGGAWSKISDGNGHSYPIYKLHVPDASVDNYKTVNSWNNYFQHIVGMSVSKLSYMVNDEVYKEYELDYCMPITPEPEPDAEEGFTFSGWSEIPETMPAYDIIVTGTFVPKMYKVSYYLDGEEWKTDSVRYSSKILLPEVPEKEGYVFGGWENVPESMPNHDVIISGEYVLKSMVDPVTIKAEDYSIKYGDPIPELTYKTEGASLIGTPSLSVSFGPSMTLDTDYTTMYLKNSDLEGGKLNWTIDGSCNASFGVIEAYGNQFDFYQEIEGLPVGTYKLELQGFYRLERDLTAFEMYQNGEQDSTKVYFYIDNNKGYMKCVFDEKIVGGNLPNGSLYTENGCWKNDNIWYPNTMQTADEAFKAGLYKSSIVGQVVNNGDKLRIGVKGDMRGANWVIWDNLRLIQQVPKPVVGVYPISVAKGSVQNQNVTYQEGTLTIEKAPLNISTGTYTMKRGEEMPEFKLNYFGFKYDETENILTKQPTIVCEATIDSDPGEYSIAVSGAEANNYEISYSNGKLIITDADLVTVTAKSYTREYGEPNPVFEFTSEGIKLDGVPEIICEATTDSPIGTYDIIVKQGTVTNYNVNYVKGKLTIIKAPLTISAGTYTMKQGDEMPAWTPSYTGFKNNETKDVLTKQPVFTCNATSTSSPGEYPIIVSGASAQNYDIKYVNGVLTVTEAEPGPETDKPKDVSGVYYLYNPASGKYLTGANYWGTCASLGEVGVDFLLEKADDNNGVLVDSRYYNNSNHHLGWPILYIDQPAAIWYFYEKENGKVVMTADNKKYLAYDGSSTILDTIPNAEDSRAHWVLMTREDIIAQMAEATKDKPVDVSTLIAYPDFGRSGSKRNTESWIDYPTIGGLSENFCGEKFDCNFDMNQTLTGMPNGHYKLRAQGFYREGADANWTVAPAVELRKNGNEHLYAMLYANEKEKQIMSIFNEAGKNNDGLDTELGLIPNNMSQASSFFSDGLYWNELGVNVTDGTLRIGIKKSVAVSRDWTCFDSFRLYYYGAAFDDDETLIADVSLTHSIPFDVYTVDGRKVRHQVKTIEGLPKGIYLVKGRKVIVK